MSQEKFNAGIEKGENVSLDLVLERHGKKSISEATRILNPEEIKQSARNENLKNYDYVGVRTTPSSRAVDTALVAGTGYMENKTYGKGVKTRIKSLSSSFVTEPDTTTKKIMKSDKDLSFNIMANSIRSIYLKAMKIAKDAKEKEDAIANTIINALNEDLIILSNAINELNTGEKISDAGDAKFNEFKEKYLKENGISALELVSRIAKHLKNYVDLTGRLNSNSKVFIKEINHAGFIEPFLVYLLKDQIEADPINPEGKNMLAKLGGSFEPSENVKITINRLGANQPVQIEFELRGKKYYLEINGENDILSTSDKLLKKIGVTQEVLEKKKEAKK